MSGPRHITGLAAIAAHYDALLCDAWGVIHNGVKVFDGVGEALSAFRAARGPVLVLTNAPRPSHVIPAQLDRLGLPRSAYDGIVTSGDATRAAIEAFLPRPAFRLGPDKDDALFEGLGLDFVPLEEAGFIVCTGLVDDAREHPADYAPLLKAAAARGLPMVCANPDKVVRWGGRLIWCAGALAEIYEGLGASVFYGGKPHPPIYDLARARIAEIAGRDIDPARILCVGDGVATDILGANRAGCGALFIAGEDGVHDGPADDASVARALREAGAHADYAAPRLVWR